MKTFDEAAVAFKEELEKANEELKDVDVVEMYKKWVSMGGKWYTKINPRWHFEQGMAVRNFLRDNGFGEKDLGVDNLDDVYIEIIELAVEKIIDDQLDKEDIISYIESCKRNGFNRVVPGEYLAMMDKNGNVVKLIKGGRVKLIRKDSIEDAVWEEVDLPQSEGDEDNENVSTDN